MTRAEAKQQGLRYYDPGRPCPKGHTGVFWLTARGCCQECQRLANASPENKARRAAYSVTAQGRAALLKAKKTYRQSKQGRKVEHDYKQVHRSRENELARERDAQKPRGRRLSRSIYPRYKLSHVHLDDREKVRVIYAAARALGMEVDHIIPLVGVGVCGLHTLCNLQLLSPEEHRVKTARETKAARLFAARP
jgi:5-methylcytosine-specific restriction endonuclease McrA